MKRCSPVKTAWRPWLDKMGPDYLPVTGIDARTRRAMVREGFAEFIVAGKFCLGRLTPWAIAAREKLSDARLQAANN